MYKKTVIFIFVFIICNAFTIKKSFISSNDLDVLFNNYTTIIEQSTGKLNTRFISEISNSFLDPYENDHINDYSTQKKFQSAQIYIYDSQRINTIDRVEIPNDEKKVLDCTFYDPTQSQSYKFLKFNKYVYYKGKKQPEVNTLFLKINISKSIFLIEEVFEENPIKNNNYLLPCNQTQANSKQQQKLNKLIEEKTKSVIVLYGDKKYIEAFLAIENVLELNPQLTKALEYKEAIVEIITFEISVSYIESLLVNNNISEAKKLASKLIKNNAITQIESNILNKKIETKENLIKQNFEFKKAEYFFNEEMYQQALFIYQKLKNEAYLNSILISRIAECKERDPELIQKRLKAAFNDVVKSKKNAFKTFKTYYKYENSGYLNGSNFRFMCQVMVRNGNKSLLKEMNISTNQATNLAIKYFYKAKEKGIDMHDIEMMVFTKNFNKKRD